MSIGDRTESALIRLLGALPQWMQKLLGGPGRRVDGQVLDPEVQLVLRLMALDPRPSFETLPIPEARVLLRHEARLVAGPTITLPAVRDLTIPSDPGSIAARLYQPGAEGGTGGLLVYFHGGGWVLGDLDSHDNTCRFLAAHARTPVLAVDYRLAPEHPFPAAVNDAVAAFRYAVDHADEFGARVGAIAVGGDSAGGNLAAVVSQALLEDEVRPSFQLLFYPVTDLSSKTRSYQLFSSGYFLTEAQMDWYRDRYLGTSSSDALDPRASPLLAPDFAGLPPAYIATAGFDPLRDEGERYGQRLAEAGVPVVARRHDGLVHGFVNAVGIGHASREATHEAAVALRTALTLAGR